MCGFIIYFLVFLCLFKNCFEKSVGIFFLKMFLFSFFEKVVFSVFMLLGEGRFFFYFFWVFYYNDFYYRVLDCLG